MAREADLHGRRGKGSIISPQLQKHQAEVAKATAIEVPSGDVAMLAHPKEVADLIIKAAE